MSILWTMIKLALGLFVLVTIENKWTKIKAWRTNRKKAHLSVVK